MIIQSDISDIASFLKAQLRSLHIRNILSCSHDLVCELPYKFAHNSAWPVRRRARRHHVSSIDVRNRSILYSQRRKQSKAKLCSLFRGLTLGDGRYSNNFNSTMIAYVSKGIDRFFNLFTHDGNFVDSCSYLSNLSHGCLFEGDKLVILTRNKLN